MPKLITFSCFMLFWIFYEMSGGADFEPQERIVVSQAPFSQVPTRNFVYDRPIVTAQATNASYIPVATEPLRAVRVATNPEDLTPIATPIPAPAVEQRIATPEPELRYVAGNRVNLRQGPGTNHQVIDTLSRGTAAELIAMNDNGWAQVRLTETDTTGWMAARLLSEG